MEHHTHPVVSMLHPVRHVLDAPVDSGDEALRFRRARGRRAIEQGRHGFGKHVRSLRLAFLFVAALLAVGRQLRDGCSRPGGRTKSFSRTAWCSSCGGFQRSAVVVAADATALRPLGPGLHSTDHWLSLDGATGVMFALIGVTVALIAGVRRFAVSHGFNPVDCLVREIETSGPVFTHPPGI